MIWKRKPKDSTSVVWRDARPVQITGCSEKKGDCTCTNECRKRCDGNSGSRRSEAVMTACQNHCSNSEAIMLACQNHSSNSKAIMLACQNHCSNSEAIMLACQNHCSNSEAIYVSVSEPLFKLRDHYFSMSEPLFKPKALPALKKMGVVPFPKGAAVSVDGPWLSNSPDFVSVCGAVEVKSQVFLCCPNLQFWKTRY